MDQGESVWHQAKQCQTDSARRYKLDSTSAIQMSLLFPGSRAAEADIAEKDVQHFGELSAGNPRYRLVHLRFLAILAKTRGDLDQWRNHLWEAVSIAASVGLSGELWHLRAALGDKDRAEEVVSSLADRMNDKKMREQRLRQISDRARQVDALRTVIRPRRQIELAHGRTALPLVSSMRNMRK